MPRIQEAQLVFAELAELDEGRMNALLRHHLAIIAADCLDRPVDSAKRKVFLEFSAEPIVEPDGGCDRVKLQIACKAKIPDYKSRVYDMKATKGGFLFNKDFPDALDQPSIFADRENEET